MRYRLVVRSTAKLLRLATFLPSDPCAFDRRHQHNSPDLKNFNLYRIERCWTARGLANEYQSFTDLKQNDRDYNGNRPLAQISDCRYVPPAVVGEAGCRRPTAINSRGVCGHGSQQTERPI